MVAEPGDIATQIWNMKYRLKQPDGTPVDQSVEDSWRRVATAVAAAESDPALWAERFLGILRDHRYLPAGRILAGAGTGRDVTLFNCFVMGTVPDSMAGIFAHLREAALTLQQGGGIGYDFSTIRPKGAPVAGVAADASGPLSFMDVWDAMCRTIMSAGSRRGAMMATLRCDHPDVVDFIEAKRTPGRLRMFNLSVLVTDPFMQAVADDAPWDLAFGGRIFRTLPARELWDRIMRSTYDSAEPGVIFIDRINAQNNLQYCEQIQSTNPCGEQPLPPYGACLLGSVNLAKLVVDPFTPEARFDHEALAEIVPVAIRLMDNVVDVSRFPLPEQAAEAKAKRRIGLGVTGLADAFLMLGVRYGSPESAALVEDWLGAIKRHSYRASAEIAAEKGTFPLFDRDKFLAAPGVAELPDEIRGLIARHGIRNALLTSIAPTGTISLFAGNVASGIEPVFAWTHTRNVLLPDGSRRAETVENYAYRLFREIHGADAPLPDYFVDAQTLEPADHLVIQAAAQKHIDSSISKTINCPEDLSFDAFKDIYAQAYALGCKGCTTYRPNAITGAVLEAQTANRGPAQKRLADAPGLSLPAARPEVLPGETYKLRWPDSDHAIYVTLNDTVVDGQRRPFEIFINSKNMEHYAWTVALTRMISAVFRRGGDVVFVVEELKAVFDPRGGQWMGGRYVPSLLAAIGETIERHMVATGFLAKPEGIVPEVAVEVTAEAVGAPVRPPGRSCPKCGHPTLIRQEGCDTCLNCGYSRCG
ncbi:adenosylcobalamin-dependent ribonucleoside-diphosphate reductase [Inquilinus sp. CA228]|uniref:adenosylcobalamin-dependent ribonucleoside-diphosphate reductase n=1 Tax=Inquilinus sp. CA228 TaxID=3455609 RepID=UPI003F8CFC3D